MKNVIEFLEKFGRIDQDARYEAFTSEELDAYIEEIYFAAGGWAKIKKLKLKDVYFPTYIIPFIFEKKPYRLAIMSGQGDMRSLFTVTACEKWLEKNRKWFKDNPNGPEEDKK